MATEFIIQSSNPRSESACDPDDASLSDAIQTVFPMDTEDMLIVWNGIYVPLSYKYDVSLMTDDILDLCSDIIAAAEGYRRICWPSNTFAAVWDIRWGSDIVTVQTQWNRVVGGTEALLVARSCISIPREDFLAEWKRPLEIVADALRKAGYTQKQIPRVAFLDDIITKLPDHGHLYRELNVDKAPP
jgi:hypothetical protein